MLISDSTYILSYLYRLSKVSFTGPSKLFSIGTTPILSLLSSTFLNTAEIVGSAKSLSPTKLAASWVKLPSGPR